MSERFEPFPDKDHGTCITCDEPMATAVAASEHMHETFMASKAEGLGRGHTVRVLNPLRADRIRMHVENVIGIAIDDVLTDLDELVSDGELTEEEVRTALAFHSDFRDSWEEDWMEVNPDED